MADDEFNVTVKKEETEVVENVNMKDKPLGETEMTSSVHNASEDSEYETLEEDNGVEEEELEDGKSFGSRGSSREDGELSDSVSVIIEDERVDGDGEEESEPKDRKLDDDEDRRNPQYIPKKGTFYEHDDRTLLDGEEVEGEENAGGDKSKEVELDGDVSNNVNNKEGGDELKQKRVTGGALGSKGKVWMDKGHDKWQHDLYNDDDQKPKSTQELIDTYGYDIRNEESPPKARRRRRYGRGPNKYTRNWEDEEAYKPISTITIRGRGGVGRGRGVSPVRGRPIRSLRQPMSGRQLNSEDLEDVPTNLTVVPKVNAGSQEEFPKLTDPMPRRPTPAQLKYLTNNTTVSGVSVSVKKMSRNFSTRAKSNERHQNTILPKRNSDEPCSNGTILMTQSKQLNPKDVKGTKISPPGLTRNFRGRGHTMYKDEINERSDAERLAHKFMMDSSQSRGRGRLPPHAFVSNGKYLSMPGSSSDVNSLQSITQKLNQFEISSSSYSPSNGEDVMRPPAGKDAVQTGILERRVQEVPPRMQETSTNIGRSKRYSAQRQRSLPESTYSPPPPVTPLQPNSNQQQQSQHQIQYFPPPPTQTISVPDYPPPPVFNENVGVPAPQIVAFIPPGPPPPPGTAPPFPPPPIINYVPTPTPFHAMPIPPPPVQQAEMFQGQNGITYYSTQTQAALHRPTPPRRVKLAIPIVPPPNDPSQARVRGRNAEQDAIA